MNIAARRVGVVLAGALVLAGCATPRPVRNLADQGAATVGLAETSLREYLTLTNAQLTARMDLIQHDTHRLAIDHSNAEFERLLAQKAGVAPSNAGAKLIRSLGEERRTTREKLEADLKSTAEDMTLDPRALTQVPTERLTAARKSFTVLAQELSAEEWVNLYVGYAEEIKKGLDQLRTQSTSSTLDPPVTHRSFEP